MSPDLIQTRIAGKNLAVPLCDDEATTAKVVNAVNEKLKEIESGSLKIDTQAFALQAAYAFAAELAQERKHMAEEEREFLIALDKLNDTLSVIIQQAKDLEV